MLLGSAVVDIVHSGKLFSQTMIIVKSLTAEAILGLNFLQDNGAVIDLDKQQLTFSGCEDAISLETKYHRTIGWYVLLKQY